MFLPFFSTLQSDASGLLILENAVCGGLVYLTFYVILYLFSLLFFMFYVIFYPPARMVTSVGFPCCKFSGNGFSLDPGPMVRSYGLLLVTKDDDATDLAWGLNLPCPVSVYLLGFYRKIRNWLKTLSCPVLDVHSISYL